MIQSDPIRTNWIQFEPIWSSSNPIWSNLIQSEPIWTNLFKFDPIWTNLIQFDPIYSNLIQFDPNWTNLIQFGLNWSNLIQFGPIWSNLIQLDLIWSNIEMGNLDVRPPSVLETRDISGIIFQIFSEWKIVNILKMDNVIKSLTYCISGLQMNTAASLLQGTS